MRTVLIFFLLFSLGCNNSHNNASNQLQQLQEVFGTANWQVTIGSDTSYIFFSPQGDNTFKTYEYRLFKGDSIDTRVRSISDTNNTVEWLLFDKKLKLHDIKNDVANWKDSADNSYALLKRKDSILLLKAPNGNFLFKKTLPLSTFLVRAKYDYEHNSNLTDSIEVEPRKIIQQ